MRDDTSEPDGAELPVEGGAAADSPSSPGVSRRWMLGAAGAGTLAAGAGIGFAARPSPRRSDGPATTASAAYPFFGPHQAGIVTPTQDRLHFAVFDVTTTDRAELVGLLRAWTVAAARLAAGRDAGENGAMSGPSDAPPDDTGEAYDLPPSGLTLTFGFGPTLFSSADGTDRFGLAARRPAALIDLPHFPGDNLDPARTGGDLCVQACANDPQVAVHAIRNLARIAFGVAAVRWSQLGFGRTSSTSADQITARNLFGFRDGTANVKSQDGAKLDKFVWVAPGDDDAAPWMVNGSYLVARRISMRIEPWDRTTLREQEAIIGRSKGTGAPLSGGTEFTAPDLGATGTAGPLIAADSHVRLAHPSRNGGVELLRRGYNFTDGTDGIGRLDAGLFFLAFVRDPVSQYVPMQTKLARDDALSEYLEHTGSAIFAAPAGVLDRSGHIGETLFA